MNVHTSISFDSILVYWKTDEEKESFVKGIFKSRDVWDFAFNCLKLYRLFSSILFSKVHPKSNVHFDFSI